MYSVSILEEVAVGSGSIWIPILVLGWFLLMTIVGWQVSRNAPAGNGSQIPDTADPDNNPSEYDTRQTTAFSK